jgi:hypothetical protein
MSVMKSGTAINATKTSRAKLKAILPTKTAEGCALRRSKLSVWASTSLVKVRPKAVIAAKKRMTQSRPAAKAGSLRNEPTLKLTSVKAMMAKAKVVTTACLVRHSL